MAKKTKKKTLVHNDMSSQKIYPGGKTTVSAWRKYNTICTYLLCSCCEQPWGLKPMHTMCVC